MGVTFGASNFSDSEPLARVATLLLLRLELLTSSLSWRCAPTGRHGTVCYAAPNEKFQACFWVRDEATRARSRVAQTPVWAVKMGVPPPTLWPLGSKSASVPQWETDLSWKGGIVGAPARSVTTKSMAMVGIPQQILRAA